MKLKYKFVVREAGGAPMAVAVGDDSDRFNGLIKLNGTARTIFEALYDDVTEDEVVRQMLEEYDVSEKEAVRAVSEFVMNLREQGLIIE